MFSLLCSKYAVTSQLISVCWFMTRIGIFHLETVTASFDD